MAAPEDLWRQMPPAVFPVLLGLVGVGLGWRQAGALFGLPPGLAEGLLGAVVLLVVLALLAYAAKTLRRPSVVLEDLRTVPGRAGLGAMGMVTGLSGLAVAPYLPSVWQPVVLAGLALQAAIAAVLALVLVRGPAEQRRPDPVLYLPFVGAIVVVPALAAEGMELLATAVFWLTLAAAAVIGAGVLAGLRRRAVPPPLRPVQAIHLAPPALLSSGALSLGMADLAIILAGTAFGVLALLLLRARWLTAGGFSPLWAAFTFPCAALASGYLELARAGAPPGMSALGAAVLVFATLITFPVAVMVLRRWLDGSLSRRTNAARA